MDLAYPFLLDPPVNLRHRPSTQSVEYCSLLIQCPICALVRRVWAHSHRHTHIPYALLPTPPKAWPPPPSQSALYQVPTFGPTGGRGQHSFTSLHSHR